MKQNLMQPESAYIAKRDTNDRRQQKFKSFMFSLYNKGRRSRIRRQDEANQPYYTDIYDKWVGLVVIGITCLSALDAFLTLKILSTGGSEVNPVMAALLEINIPTFILGKTLITSICLIFVMVHINFKVLRLFPMRKILGSLFFIYSCLIGYEGILLSV